MHSLWWETCQIQERQTLKENLETEILVIGGGMAGILTAYQLHKAGKKVLVLEADRIGSGQTRNTTAKITSQHGLCYHGFLKKLGTEKARIYASANQATIQEYENIINTEQIACDFEKQSSFVYGKSKKDLELEVQAATSLGLPASLVQENLTLPFPVWGAVTFQNQAQFHPLKFLYSLSEHLVIYEHSPVYKVEENTAYTKSGTVKAEKIIFTCHIPFLNFPGAYFARIHQERSYVLALEDHGMKTNGMYIGSGKQSFSFRNYGSYLLFGGMGHRIGEESTVSKYQQLRTLAAQWFPKGREICCWSAQDGITSDGLPYIGPYAKSKPNWYVAAGFQKWGMTSSMVAAILLRDLILERDNPWEGVFTPKRFSSVDIPFLCKEGGHSVKGLTRQLLASQNPEKPPVCPHMGCQLEWNPEEESWDCPCHGSRFDKQGTLLNGPAQTSLSPSCSLKK